MTGLANTSRLRDVHACVIGTKTVPGVRLFHLEADHAPAIVYFVFWVLRYDDHVVLVDGGFPRDKAEREGVRDYRDPTDCLAQLGLTLEDVTTVVVSHLHWDHFCRPERFPSATFVVQQEDVDYFTGRGRTHPIAKIAEVESLHSLDALRSEDRLVVLTGDAVIDQGLRVELVGGHTPGSQIIVIDHYGSPLVLACDASHFYENLEKSTPTSLMNNYDSYQRGFATITAAANGGRWFPGHDPIMLEQLERLGEGVYRVPELTR